jgi:hypothetical protein
VVADELLNRSVIDLPTAKPSPEVLGSEDVLSQRTVPMSPSDQESRVPLKN